MLNKIFLLVFLFFSTESFSQESNVFFTSGMSQHSALLFAKDELKGYLSVPEIKVKAIKFQFEFSKTNNHKNGSFSYQINRKGKAIQVVFSGEDETTMTHAVHSFLEHLGYRFEISGTVRLENIRPDTLSNGTYSIAPFVRWRGIRQHVNFPMDISSYPIDEAKEYLRNLLRMRFNKVAVHSYPNLWHEVYTSDTTEYAGNFFYNREHQIPDHPIIKNNIRFNKKIFSIPAIEPFYADQKMKSTMAMDWMRELLNYAKSIGLRVHFSVEPRAKGDVNYIVDNCRSALKNYPMIDELEIITEELGGWGNTCTDTAIRSVLVSHFGTEILSDSMVTRVIKKTQTDLDNLMNQVGRNIAALRIMKADPWFKSKSIDYKLGVYCTIVPYADVAYHLVRKYMPETEVAIMPGHGSVRTANHFSQINATEKDLEKTTVFSWIEFDGLMYTQQNPIAGIEKLMGYLKSRNKSGQINAVMFNHWRTAESVTGARYAAISSLYGPVSSTLFYKQYAQGMGIKISEVYVTAMKKLEEIDLLSTNDLPNVGFCWVGAWLQGGPYTWMSPSMLHRVKNMYDTVGESIDMLQRAIKNKSGVEYLSFLSNRISASSLYLKAFEVGTEIQNIKKDSAGFYSIASREQAVSICNRALLTYENYMQVHAKKMLDRGTEGTLISLWHGPIYGLKVLRKNIGGVDMDAPVKPEKATDAPPLPILMKK